MRRWLQVCLDIAVVLTFAALGRNTHQEGTGLVVVLGTALPFLIGAAVGWLLVWFVSSRRDSPDQDPRSSVSLLAGTGVWLVTVCLGMAIRSGIGDGTALAFVIVAFSFLGLGMLGWRLITVVVRRNRSSSASATAGGRPSN